MIQTFSEALEYASVGGNRPTLLLGNGFSVAQSYDRFSYTALLESARKSGLVGERAELFFTALGTVDFEQVIESLQSAMTALTVIDASAYSEEIATLRGEAEQLKEALARVLADLHPERPSDISPDAYGRVRRFLSNFDKAYTANYDLLLYWALMHEMESEDFDVSLGDDGFREAAHDADYVVWDYLNPWQQNVHYIHGALHLYRDQSEAELQKITWSRTGEALIDQIRRQLNAGRYPLIVTEGTSKAKLAKIQTSDYLSRSLRSLKECRHGALAFGLSFSPNDEHIMKAIVESTIRRLAVGIYGDPASASNISTINAAHNLSSRRAARPGARTSLEVEFFDAGSVELWNEPT